MKVVCIFLIWLFFGGFFCFLFFFCGCLVFFFFPGGLLGCISEMKSILIIKKDFSSYRCEKSQSVTDLETSSQLGSERQ